MVHCEAEPTMAGMTKNDLNIYDKFTAQGKEVSYGSEIPCTIKKLRLRLNES